MKLHQLFEASNIDEVRPADMPPAEITHTKKRVDHPDVSYYEKPKSKKEAHIITKVIVTLKGKKSEIATKLAQKFELIASLKRDVEKEAAELRDMQAQAFANYFTEEDEAWTNVIETASMIMTKSAASPATTKEKETMDWDSFFKDLIVMFPHMEAQFRDLKEKYHNIDLVDVPKGTPKIMQPKFKNESIYEADDADLKKIARVNDKIGAYIEKLKAKWGITGVTEDWDEIENRKAEIEKKNKEDHANKYDQSDDYGYDEREIFDYLEALRDSGATNMFGAAPYLTQEFGMDRKVARHWLMKWMQSYS